MTARKKLEGNTDLKAFCYMKEPTTPLLAYLFHIYLFKKKKKKVESDTVVLLKESF